MARIGLVMDNSIEYVDKLLDIWNQNDTAVLVDWRIPTKEVVNLLKLSNVDCCYVDDVLFGDFENVDRGIKYIAVKKQSESRISFLPDYLYMKFQYNISNYEALILFSSGTTGASKGIILSHYAIQKNAEAIMGYMRLDSNDRLYILKTFAHSSTIVGELLVALKYKIPVMIAPTVTLIHISLKKIFENDITVFCVNPTLMYLMNKTLSMLPEENDVSNVRKIYVSGASSSIAEIKKMKAFFRESCIYNVYGLSEAGPRVTAQLDECPIGSVGKPIAGVNVAIIDRLGKEKEMNQEGSIHVLTEYSFIGYVNGEKRESYRKGWINTGDIGYFDENQNLFIKGRADEMILTGSHNVYPDEVEKVILDYEKIRDCIVYGVKNELLGEKIVCMYCSSEELFKKEILDNCKNKLSAYEMPKEFIRIDSIFKTRNGKKSRKLAKEFYYKYFNTEEKSE